MGINCPYCGNVQEQDVCTCCNHNIKWVKSVYHKSEVYYQKGYDLACQRNLTQSIPYLKKAIQYDKYHIAAHNVLGLVYFELGDVGNALKTWILSTSVAKENNAAVDYLEEVHKGSQSLENYKQAIRLYNEALSYLKNGNDDMCIIRLKKAIQLSEQFVEARNLLALAYIQEKKYGKAMEQIMVVLTIDEHHEKALFYLKELQGQLLGRKGEKIKNSASHTKMMQAYYGAHKVINRGHVLGTAVFYFVFGIVCMMGIEVALILPSKTEALEVQLQNTAAKSEEDLAKMRGSLAEASVEIITLKDENKKITAQKEELQNMNSKLAQQNRISAVVELKNARQWVEGAEMLYRIAPEQLEEAYRKQYDELVKEVYPEAADVIYADGLGQYNNEQYVEAFAQFEKVQLYVPKTTVAAKSLYYMGMIEEKNNQIDKAVQYYETICAEYEGIDVYYRAKQRLERIAG